MNIRRLGIAMLLLAWPLGACGATYYLDPAAGRLGNDGSAGQPLPGLEQVLRAGLIRAADRDGVAFNTNGFIRGGDQLVLRDGLHGEAILNGYHFDEPLRVAAEAGATPKLTRIFVRGGSRWIFSGLDVSPAHAAVDARGAIIAVVNHSKYGTSSHVVVEHCRVASAPADADWSTPAAWLGRARDGITFEGDHCRAVSNHVHHIAWGIQLAGVSNYAGHNLIEHFRGDGLRTLNHHAVAEYNTIRNAYLVDDNHMDGIQGYFHKRPGAEVRGVVIRGNTILRHENLDAPLVAPYLQGIGFFDGPFVDCVFEDNVVEADSYHGLSVYNATRCRIVNNTVREDGGTNYVHAARIVLGYKAAHPGEVRDNQIRSNRCDTIVLAPQAVGTVLEGNTTRARP